MSIYNKIKTYYHTVRYLRPVQLYGRVWFKLYRPHFQQKPAPPLRRVSRSWVPPAVKHSRMESPTGFCLLNEFNELTFPEGWNCSEKEKLWLYNLHYFDFLNTDCLEEQGDWHRSLMERWIADNPLGHGNGWEPYPMSLRIVNWIKWDLAGNQLKERWIESLAMQVRYLSKRLEWHLLGNHLFANVKALVFAGIYFEGDEADGWLEKGLKILDREIDEQILGDGGHFERSPMYHSIIFEDLLDLLNLFSAYPAEALLPRWHQFPKKVGAVAMNMHRWLNCMIHPDGDIALFNDAAFGVAPSPRELGAYSERLGLASPPFCQNGIMKMLDSGYLRCQCDDVVLIADVGEIGPDYLPGHAHADTLGFEMSLFRQRVFVDSGISCYGSGAERLRQRSTSAHNTMEIEGENSSEVWGGFRVARRARPKLLKILEKNNRILIHCMHDGYTRLPGRPLHGREWCLAANSFRITDSIDGKFSKAVVRYHLHPDVAAAVSDCGQEGYLVLPGKHRLAWRLNGGAATVVSSTYHPQFGVSLPNHCLEVVLEQARMEFIITWK